MIQLLVFFHVRFSDQIYSILVEGLLERPSQKNTCCFFEVRQRKPCPQGWWFTETSLRPVSFYLEGFSAKQKSLHSRHIQVTCRTREHREQLKTTAPRNVGPWVLAGVEHNISQFQTFKCIPGTRLSFSTFRPLHNMRINATKIEISPQQADMSQICWKYKPVFTLNTKYEQIPVEI